MVLELQIDSVNGVYITLEYILLLRRDYYAIFVFFWRHLTITKSNKVDWVCVIETKLCS